MEQNGAISKYDYVLQCISGAFVMLYSRLLYFLNTLIVIFSMNKDNKNV